jgi:hypothetical protein
MMLRVSSRARFLLTRQAPALTLSSVRFRAIGTILAASTMIVVALLVARGSSATTGKPLPLAGRVMRAGDFPGFVPKQQPSALTDVAAWNKVAPSGGIDIRTRLTREGFVAGVREDLAWTKGNDRGALSAAVRLGSPAAARTEITEQLRDFHAEVGHRGVLTYSAFAVPGIPGAHGFTKTAKDGAGHNIIWADGPFTYHVGVGWGPQVTDKPTQAQLISAAKTLYSRVHNRTAP